MADESSFMLDILVKVAGPLISAGGKLAFNRITAKSPISKAIDATVGSFERENIEDLSNTLSSWCESEAFWDTFERISEGERNITDSSLVASFVEVTGFYMGKRTLEAAETVIQLFFDNLERELYNSEEGIGFLAHRIEVLHEETSEQNTRFEARLTEVVHDSMKQFSSQLKPDDITVSAEVQGFVLNQRIDAARSLIDGGQVLAARYQLLEIRNDTNKMAIGPEIRFRIATNIGACALALGVWDTAKSEFIDALDLLPDDSKALRNAGVAATLDEDWERALELSRRARDADPNHRLGIDVFLGSLFRLGRLDELDEFLQENDWIREELLCPLVLARIDYDRGNLETAEEILRQSLDNKEEPLIHGLLGQIIAFPIQRALNQDPPLPWKILVETKSRLEDSEQHLSRAVELLEDHQDREGLHNVLVNRAAVRGMLGKLEEGLEDCNRVLSENPEENVAIRNKGIMLFHLSRSSESITAFEKLRGTKDWSNVALMVASSYYDIDEPRNSVETIEPLWEPDRQDHHELLTSHFLIKAYHKLSDRNAVGRVIEIIKAKWPNDPEALLVLGQHKYQDGDVDDAFELMREGMSYAQNNQRDRIALQLAESLYQQKRYAEAAEIYEGIVDTTANDSTFRAYLTSLFNAGYYLDALKLARTARGDGLPIPVVSEVEVLVLELIGDLEQAENILTGLVDLEPRKALHKLRLANAKLRRRESEAAKEVIQLIEYEDMKDDAQTLIEVALMRRITGLGEGLPLVYRARRIDFNNPEVHVAYVQYFLDVEQGEELDFRPAIADIDCTVHLKRGGQRRIYTILDEDPLEASRGELSPNNSLATRLIGKKKGDTINLKEELDELTYEIIEVQSKFVHAYQQTLAEFPKWFPDHMGIQRVSVEGDDISKVLRPVDVRHNYVSGIVAEYKLKKITLGTLAKMTGVSQFAVWGSLTSRYNEQFLVAMGTTEERAREASLLSSTTRVVMDLTSLLTLESLEVLDKVPGLFDEILITQAVLDELLTSA